MLVKDLKELLSGVRSNYLVLFRVDSDEVISFDMIEVSYQTKEIIFRKTVSSEEEKQEKMFVNEVLSIIGNLSPSWDVVFEDIDEPSETYTIDSAEVSLLNNAVTFKHWNI